ncbi:tRNA epoxyqueuosine(34) reductase QueG [Prevotella sp. A2931]|uniref:tRNA epoxyqueuosine(34) reductase QueG n=1 Tax=Prevotella illustrans TaxID=2800387 RepID=A0ABS3M5U6_9BACT|nr:MULTISPECIES: tRNA epoxyqueuosine(34) reductase QueG [Prevotella]MBO1363485.1 tRNA epoxyqueuosine(34) reductase QueG [Prevotella illustrans]PTL26067.1 tRNA epoxyqueuosine(34) reductase QueG [Prevotella sp. oral taxon 820]
MNSRLLTDKIKAEATRLGFFACGIAKAGPVNDKMAQQLRAWLESGGYAGMEYMANHTDKRLDPRLLMPGLKSIVCVALNYAPRQNPDEHEYQLAAYALGKDYHDIVKAKLRQLANSIGAVDCLHEQTENDSQTTDNKLIRCRVFVDSGPVLERYWAEQAGLGWIGKNHQLIIPFAGSMFFLGELFLSVELEYDSPTPNRCGNCHKCIDACPTGAIQDFPSTFDTERCLSYQLIENRGALSKEARQAMDNTIYGCDRCQKACPWNRFATPNTTPELQPSTELLAMKRANWQQLTEEQYRKLFKGSAVKRAKYAGLKRNIDAAAQAEAAREQVIDKPDTAQTADKQ